MYTFIHSLLNSSLLVTTVICELVPGHHLVFHSSIHSSLFATAVGYKLVPGHHLVFHHSFIYSLIHSSLLKSKVGCQSINQSIFMLELKTVFAWLSQNFFNNL